jgi:hypothetical protein
MLARTMIAIAEMKIMVHDHYSVSRQMHIQLDRVSAEVDGSRECRKCILGKLAWGAAMANSLDVAS